MPTNHTTNNQITKRSALVAALCFAAASCLATTSNSAERPFSFRDAENYINEDDAVDWVKAFVASQLAPGLPRADAVERLTRAGADCGRPKSADTLTCTFVGVPQDRWTIRLTLDSHAEVSKATVDRVGLRWPRD
jgi:hypothetical protein